uniref:Uncharacterized protein n=1 Tax=Anguilla anguilla TaxID=7936 RepID=A0A0E9V8B2_ANGAN
MSQHSKSSQQRDKEDSPFTFTVMLQGDETQGRRSLQKHLQNTNHKYSIY